MRKLTLLTQNGILIWICLLASIALVAPPYVAVTLGLVVSVFAKWILTKLEVRQQKEREVTMRKTQIPTICTTILEVIRTMGNSVAATAVLTKG